ncbi:DUF3396 domain-containing protein [Longispora sp. K20-0274]|uniref:type VI immunity family protein n=1 Tax=Longispora sp. K20-0274 TaxID=3088255 RepID=UPI00399AE90A
MHATIAEILDVVRRTAALEGDDREPHPPGGPAGEDAIARAVRRFGDKLSPAYLDFLRQHDGWSRCPWGMRLFGVDELCGETGEWARGMLDDLDDDGELPEELTDAVVIGRCDNTAQTLLLVASGEVVDFLYEEDCRYPDLDGFLADVLDVARDMLAGTEREQRAAAERTDPGWRAGAERTLLAELRAELAAAPPPEGRPAAPPRTEERPAPVTPAELVHRDGDGEELAYARLNLVLYLGAYPSREELVGAFRAFRRHFPVEGELAWGLPARFYVARNRAADPDSEDWADAVRADASGLYGVRLAIGDHVLNVCGVPDTDDGEPRASFCEVMLPVDADPHRLAALAADLTELLPVRSGHGGYGAYASPSAQRTAYREIFRWCRRFLALDVGHLDGWLTSTWRWVLGAGWLTVLGPTLATVLAERAGAPAFGDPAIEVRGLRGGSVLIRAGAVPTLGDVARDGFPHAQAEVEHYLAPLKLTRWSHTALLMLGGGSWRVGGDELPGGFHDHRMTGAWLRRLLDPAAFLGPSVLERGAELLARLHAEHPGEHLAAWHSHRDEPSPHQLCYRLIAAAADAGPTDAAMAATELVVTELADAAGVEAFGNVLVLCLVRGEPDRALRHLDAALEIAPKNPFIWYCAARVAARTGSPDRAVELLAMARDHGVPVGRARTESDLATVWSDPRFTALTASD